jgi:hypothetical protein
MGKPRSAICQISKKSLSENACSGSIGSGLMFQGRDKMKRGEFVWAVGCQVGNRTEGERTEACGKGTGSPSHEPLARSSSKVVIQFTGGNL